MITSTNNAINAGLSSGTIGAIVGGILGGLGALTLVAIFIIFCNGTRSIILPDNQPISDLPDVEDSTYEQPCGRLFPEKDQIKTERPSGRTEHDGEQLSGRINKY